MTRRNLQNNRWQTIDEKKSSGKGSGTMAVNNKNVTKSMTNFRIQFSIVYLLFETSIVLL